MKLQIKKALQVMLEGPFDQKSDQLVLTKIICLSAIFVL